MRDLIDKNYVYGAIVMWKSARKLNVVGVVVEVVVVISVDVNIGGCTMQLQ